ncbi:MAG TPA: zinc-ribbon domain-containing protein, partial [Kofleriaceae bacterium]|nr:zinc-ribbon domain-containing protein [Kofleriaceae bacterium]
MDVRCEKCQTEYELDEARLKPGGVTVKCTNCGHMFKVRKREPTNVGAAPSPAEPRARPSTSRSPMRAGYARPDSLLHDAETVHANDEGPTTVERQWVVRLSNGDQKSCRELATLQQWIISGVVSRDSLISRTGKTWKRLGDINELAQYFDIADEARTAREKRPGARATPGAGQLPRVVGQPANAARGSVTPPPPGRGTMLGVSGGPQVQPAGGAAPPDDDDDERRTGRAPLPPKLPPGAKTPPMGSATAPKPPASTPPPIGAKPPAAAAKTPPMGSATAPKPPAAHRP